MFYTKSIVTTIQILLLSLFVIAQTPPKPSAFGGGKYCFGDTLKNLTAVAGTGGGNGIFKWYLNPGLTLLHDSGSSISPLSSVGTRIYYLVEELNGTNSTSDTVKVVIDSIPMVSLTAFASICRNSGSLNLSGGKPTGGVYSGTGVSSGGIFSPASAGSGTHSISYTFTDANSCTGFTSKNLEVDTLPTITFPQINPTCAENIIYPLIGGSPANGRYSGPGVNGNTWNPFKAGAGAKTLSYSFTDLNGCSDSLSQQVTIHVLPKVLLTMPKKTCLNSPADTLNTGTPVGGTYDGRKVSNGVYSHTVIGFDTVVYIYTDSNSCTNSDTAVTEVVATPNVNFSIIPNRCAGSDSLVLNQGSPIGGVYYGNNVTNGKHFSSSPTIDTISYVFIDGNNCKDSSTQTAIIDSIPIVTLSNFIAKCENSSVFILNQGLPIGGTYSGKGVSGSNYDPNLFGVGIDTITYVFTDGNNCSDSLTKMLSVHPKPKVSMNPLNTVCALDSSFTLYGASPSGGKFSGKGVVFDVFQPDTSIVGTHVIKYWYKDGNNCEDSAKGSITVAPNPIFDLGPNKEICGDETVTLLVPQSNMNYRWSTGDTSQSITVQSSGVFDVLVIDSLSTKGCTYKDTVRVDYDTYCVGVQEDKLENADVKLYPNPNKGTFMVLIEGLDNSTVKIKIVNLLGRVVYQNSWDSIPVLTKKTISLNENSEGVYLLILTAGEQSFTRKIFLVK